MNFSIATWNINSVRLRIDLVLRFLKEAAPDVLCLQETKCPDSQFPIAEFKKLGYGHVAVNGQKGYHGVATISRHPFSGDSRRDFCAKGDSRHLAVTLWGWGSELEIHNFYVPAGGDDPDWSAADKGRRLDHIWVTPLLADNVRAMKVHREARGWERPSDHAPVTVELAL